MPAQLFKMEGRTNVIKLQPSESPLVSDWFSNENSGPPGWIRWIFHKFNPGLPASCCWPGRGCIISTKRCIIESSSACSWRPCSSSSSCHMDQKANIGRPRSGYVVKYLSSWFKYTRARTTTGEHGEPPKLHEYLMITSFPPIVGLPLWTFHVPNRPRPRASHHHNKSR